MKKLPVECTTVDMTTGKTIKTEMVGFGILPPKPGLCAVCAVDHDPRVPHNAQSLYYQYQFKAEFDRWPTWADAIADTSPEMQAKWKETLTEMGHWSQPEGEPIPQPYEKQKES